MPNIYLAPTSSDNTAAFNNAVQVVVNGTPAGGVLSLGPGEWPILGHLDVTGFGDSTPARLTIQGAGKQATTFHSHGLGSGAVLDLTGSSRVCAERFQIQLDDGTPQCGILLATAGSAGSTSTANHLDLVAAAETGGAFQVAALVAYASGDAVLNHCEFVTHGYAHAAVYSARNDYGLTTVAAGGLLPDGAGVTCSDIAHFSCEFHQLGSGTSIYLNRTGNVSFFGGCIGNNRGGYFGLFNGPATTTVLGASCYADGGPGAPCDYAVEFADTVPVVGLSLRMGGFQCRSYILGSTSGMAGVVQGLDYFGCNGGYGGCHGLVAPNISVKALAY